MEQSTMTTEQQVCEQHFITHATQQQDGRFVVRLPTKMDPKQLGSSCLSAERRLHAIERRLERDPEFKVQYHNFMRKYKGLDHRDPLNSQEGKKHPSVYQSSILQGNMFHHKSSDYYGIQQMISFKSRTTPPRCNQQTPQRAQNEGC